MNLRLITYLAIISSYINCSHINKQLLIKCNSAPDLRALHNTTIYMSAISTGVVINENKIIPYNKYKSLIFNRYKRNIYLRSKEKYTFSEK